MGALCCSKSSNTTPFFVSARNIIALSVLTLTLVGTGLRCLEKHMFRNGVCSFGVTP